MVTGRLRAGEREIFCVVQSTSPAGHMDGCGSTVGVGVPGRYGLGRACWSGMTVVGQYNLGLVVWCRWRSFGASGSHYKEFQPAFFSTVL